MKFKNVFLLISIIIFLFISSFILAQEKEELIDPNIPDSWYESPKTASEMEINEFSQSPMLDDKVEEGELPPVEERLPNDPPVIEPYKEVGKYGGTLTVWGSSLNGRNLSYFYHYNFGGGRKTPDGGLKPSHLKGWEYSDDHTKMTLHLREGMKFSDGSPLNADDYMYWWEHVANNKVLEPTPPEEWNPALLDVTKEDDWTVTFHYDRPVPNNEENLRLRMNPSTWMLLSPSDYMKQFHPDFVGEEEVKKMAEEAELDRWEEYYSRIQNDSQWHPEYEHTRPLKHPYIPVERTETTLILERNPYYPFVDTEGNQLPYIDKIRINLGNDEEMVATKAATGEADFAIRRLNPYDIPLYKRNEKKEDYRVNIYQGPADGSAIYLNHSTTNEKYKKVFEELNFRKALSHAINRENINRKVYHGRGFPRQATVNPLNEYFKEEYAEAYAEYDPEKAEKLLDEMGMIDQDDDGYRETPDGEDFTPTFLYCKYDIDPTPILELVRSDWSEIGINIELKMVSRELHDTRKRANNFDIGCWALDMSFGTRFKHPSGMRYFAPVFTPAWVQWPGWVNWYSTDGEEGVEPPEKVKRLIDHAETVIYSTNENKKDEAIEKLLESQADNLWMIGTVGMYPQPMIVNNKVKNVPEKGVFSCSLEFMNPYHTDQFYIDE